MSNEIHNYQNLSLKDLPNEVWVDCFGYIGSYQVSNMGRIKSLGRYVCNGKSERWVKEKIRKQCYCKKQKRLTCPFSINNIKESQNIPALIYFSFNKLDDYSSKKDCIMHKDKDALNNKLDNLELTTVSKSHSNNYKKGLLNHLFQARKLHHKYTNSTAIFNEEKRTIKRLCKCCNELKEQSMFSEYGRNKCRKCRNEKRKESDNYKNMLIEAKLKRTEINKLEDVNNGI